MGFNRRKLEDQRREAAEKETAARRATDAQVLEDAERLIAAHSLALVPLVPARRRSSTIRDHSCCEPDQKMVARGWVGQCAPPRRTPSQPRSRTA